MKAKVYTLVGSTESPLVALDILLSYYFKALKSSSSIVQNEVFSLIWDINTARNNTGIITNITNSLVYILNKHFDTATVDVTVTGSSSNYEISIAIALKDNGVNINVGKLVTASNTRIEKLVDISEKGTR